MAKGPIVFAAVRLEPFNSMAKPLISQFLTQLLVALLGTILLTQTSGLSYQSRVVFLTTVGIIIFVGGHFDEVTWWSFSNAYLFMQFGVIVIGWFLGVLDNGKSRDRKTGRSVIKDRLLKDPSPIGRRKEMNKGRHYRGGYRFAGLADLTRELRAKQTTAEALLWELLRNRRLLGFKFRRQHQFGDYAADFYCHEARLVIECDGSVHDPNERWHHDRERDAYMVAQGLRVLRFRNEQVLVNPEKVLREISKYLPSPVGRRVGDEGL